MTQINIIAAIGANNEIGLNGDIPWGKFPEDLKHFKSLTIHSTIIMGRKTWESIGCKKLPNRRNIVVSRDINYLNKIKKDVNCFQSIKSAIKSVTIGDIFIIGGSEIYEQTIDLSKKIYLTQIHKSFDANTYFPMINDDDWKTVNCISSFNNDFGYSFIELDRV